MNRCSSCRYFDSAGNNKGICRRYPPSSVEDLYLRNHPPVDASGWCGEHKRHPTKKTKEPKVNVGEVIAFYCEKFKEKFGMFPTILGKDKAATERMLEKHTITEVNHSIADFFSNTLQWNIDNNCYGLNSVESTWDKRAIRSAELEVKTADDITYKEMLDEQYVMWSTHPMWNEYEKFILDTRELMMFEEFLKEYEEG